jgi:hypothetical protein
MSWKLKNSKILDDLYLSQIEKYNPEMIYHADDIIEGLKKLNKELPSQNIMILRSNNSNKGFACFNGNNCDDLNSNFEKIMINYKLKYDNIRKIFDTYKK